jgi:hypothetical protein
MIEAVQQRVRLRGKYQVEFKFDYELLKGKQTSYQISTYIFFPNTLGITPSSYSKGAFYRDTQNYIRLKTPELTLRDFTERSDSPLNSIESIITQEGWAGNSRHNTQLKRHFKFLSAMFKTALREHFNLIYRRINEAAPDSKIHLLIANLIEDFLVESRKITDTYRSYFPDFNLPNVNPEVFAAYQLTDESLSLQVEEHAIEMFEIVDQYVTKKGERAEFVQALTDYAQAEVKYRRSHGYPSILNPEDDNEEFLYHTSILKKYAYSVLLLSTAFRREGTGLEQMLFAIAAGIAMLFATIVGFYFQQQFGNFTFPLLIVLVVGYMFKDRLKVFVQRFFARYLQNRLYDHRIVIRTPDGQRKLGILREKMTFVSEQDIPKAILKRRSQDQFVDRDSDGRGEYVILHLKEIVLFNRSFKGAYADMPEITGINDITRYDIRKYLRKMGNISEERNYIDEGELRRVTCQRVYHMNLISRYRTTSPEKAKTYRRVRLILNRKGVRRVEHVPFIPPG